MESVHPCWSVLAVKDLRSGMSCGVGAFSWLSPEPIIGGLVLGVWAELGWEPPDPDIESY